MVGRRQSRSEFRLLTRRRFVVLLCPSKRLPRLLELLFAIADRLPQLPVSFPQFVWDFASQLTTYAKRAASEACEEAARPADVPRQLGAKRHNAETVLT